ncbi:MAG: stealth family protein [Oscillospiraceae bacterium]|nr:stealth family protein [Oscillospiraceae bacterium]
MDIDVVILWVNGADPAWLEEKKKYTPPAAADSNSPNRYRDWGLLPYWFRSIDRFMPWVRKVHLVTWGHVPAFLNCKAPKLNVVKHTDFIPAEYLPTFSSHAIEMNIHRIPDLSEHFVYFNDDTFLLRPMSESDFFRNGLPCTYGREEPWIFTHPVGIWSHAAANDLGIINRHFSKREAVSHHREKFYSREYRWKDNLRTWVLNRLYPDHFSGFRNLHAPAAYLKKTFEAVWEAEPELLQSTCRDRFRKAENVNQWVCLWWQVASGDFSPCVIDNLVNSVTEETIDALCSCIESQSHTYICLNDPEQPVDFAYLSRRLRDSFEKLLPERSQFEINYENETV